MGGERVSERERRIIINSNSFIFKLQQKQSSSFQVAVEEAKKLLNQVKKVF